MTDESLLSHRLERIQLARAYFSEIYCSKKARIYYFISIPKGSVRGFRERENFEEKLHTNRRVQP